MAKNTMMYQDQNRPIGQANIDLNESVTARKGYFGMEDVSSETFPLSPLFYSAQLMRMAVIIGVVCFFLIFIPLIMLEKYIGGWRLIVSTVILIYSTLLLLYAGYLRVWITKFKFKFFTDYIDIIEGVVRRINKAVPFDGIRRTYVAQGIFERMGHLAHVVIKTFSSGSALNGYQAPTVIINGLSVEQAYHLVAIINSCIAQDSVIDSRE